MHISKSLKISQPFPKDSESELKIASDNWEQFVQQGDFHAVSPRQVICEAWVKSRELGLDPNIPRAKTVMNAEQLEKKLRQGDLGKAALSIMESLSDSLSNSKHVIVLADSQGRMLHSVGHEEVQGKLEDINFRPGGLWSEQEVGPNGIGTPLAIGRPEVVMGHEHYCTGWQPWVCYGAPIPDVYGTGSAGVIDITGPVSDIRAETMSLAISLSHSIHSGLSFLQLHRREILRSVSREKMMRWPSDGVLVLDENGYIIDYNQRATRLMNLTFPDCVENPITHFLPSIWQVAHKCIQNNIYEEFKLDMKTDGGLTHNLRVRIEPILYRDEHLGALLVVTGQERLSASEIARAKRQQPANTQYTFDDIRGSSESIKAAMNIAHAAAHDPLNSSVLIIGETGTGKELVAQSIHAESQRADQPFIALNCAALPKDLIESELFGYVPSTINGARKNGMKGKFEHANGGTIFLDEIDSLDPVLQSKFLRVLDNKVISRIGSVETIDLDVRVIAAGSPKLHKMVEEGNFREDLFHRLSVLEIPLPPLRDRGEDLLELTYEFLERECWAAGRQLLDLTEEVSKTLLAYTWPGNVRELNNLCKRWVLLASGDSVEMHHLPEKLQRTDTTPISVNNIDAQSLRAINDELIKATLIETNGNISKAAKVLGIDRTTIYRRKKNWESN